MAATTSDRYVRMKAHPLPVNGNAPVAASTVLYTGTMAIINGSGHLANPAGSDGATTKVVFIPSHVDNGSGAAADVNGDFQSGVIVRMVGSGLTQANVGGIAYVADNQTITTTAGTNAIAGTIVAVENATTPWVYIKGLLQ